MGNHTKPRTNRRTSLIRLVLFTVLAAAISLRAQIPSDNSVKSVTVSKWVTPLKIDGDCSDPSYKNATSMLMSGTGGHGGAAIRLIHSGLDFFVCAKSLLSSRNSRLVFRVDSSSQHPRQPGGSSSIDEFSITRTGKIAA